MRIVKKPILSLIPLAILSSRLLVCSALTVDNIYLVPPLAFCMGLVTTAFGEVSGIAYNNAFYDREYQTNHASFGEYFGTKHTPFLREGFIFVSLLSILSLALSFSAYLTIFYHEKTILRCSYYDEYFLSKHAFCILEKKVKEKASF